MRRILIAVVLLAGLLLAADRIAAAVAASAVAGRIARAESLQARPAVRFRGFPFLTQAVAGRYRQVDVTVSGLRRSGVRVERIDASLYGVDVALSAVLDRQVGTVPVQRTRASVLLSYRDLAAVLADRGLRLSGAGDLLRVEGRISALGRVVPASADATVAVDGSRIKATARSVRLGPGLSSAALTAAAGGRLSFSVDAGRLPFGLRLRDARVTPDGLLLGAAGPATLISAGAG